MKTTRLVTLLIGALPALAQQTAIEPVRPSGNILIRPYEAATVPPVRLSNSDRIRSLLRAGNLYLTAQDAIALALDNNIDIEISRYDTSLLEWRLERAQAGGALPGVPSGATQASSVANGQGVLGSQAAAGVSINGANGGTGGTANVTVAQIGPVAQTLDPSLQESSTFSHRAIPQPDTVQTIVSTLIQNQRIYTGSYQQGFLTGGSLNLSYNDHFLNENAPTDLLNPSSSATLSFTVQQNLLQGLGVAVNARNITVAKMNLAMSDLNFRDQVTSTVVDVLNSYYALVAAVEDVNAKQNALSTAERFLEESRQRLELGALAQLDVTTAQNQAAVARQALIDSETNMRQQELQLKNLISRNGLGDPLIAATPIVPVDHLTIPASDNLPSVRELVQQALAHRPDLLVEQQNIKVSEVSALGTKNGVLPPVQALASRSNAGLEGTPRIAEGPTSNPYFVGGIGNALGQIARQNFPSENVAAFGRVPLHNGQAQADYGVDQLQLRQQNLTTAKDLNQAQVDIVNSVVALRQGRAAWDAAVQNRTLQEQLLDAEQKKFNLGASTSYNVIQQQRDLAAAQSAELAALVRYQTARTSLDQLTGATLEANHISLEQAKADPTKAR
jgi:outer membrane protein TolC